MERFNYKMAKIITRLVSLLAFWRPKGRHYQGPVLVDPYAKPRSRHSTRKNRKGRKRLQRPECIPGTITYRDWLVRHVGYDRRLADRMLATWREDTNIRMPLPTDSATLAKMI